MTGPHPLTTGSDRVRRAARLGRRRHRTRAREFLAEGPQAVREALAQPGVALEVFATEEAARRHADLTRGAVPWRIVGSDVVAAIATTVQPQGILARCRFVDTDLATALGERPRMAVVCADVREPGNAGTVLRCADAAGAGTVVFVGDSVDPYNPKAVRASVGCLFHLGLAVTADVADTLAELRAAGLTVLAGDGDASLDLPQARERGLLDGPTAWVFGNEAWGLSEAARAAADHVVAVPIYGRAESLNLAAAAAVCVYASASAHHAR